MLKVDDFDHNTCSYVHMNGICDDFANTEGNNTNLKNDSFHQKSHSKNWVFVGCNYDGGDCCLSKINTKDCTECICKQDMVKQISYENLGCDQELLGDGFCDDDMNNMMCNYDGGDCCAHVVPSPMYFGLTEWVYPTLWQYQLWSF